MLSIAAEEVQEGEMLQFKLDSKPIMVAKAEGRIYAISDRCTHLGCRLSEGKLEGTIVTCPCHGTKYNMVDGKVVEYVSNWPRIMQKAASLLIRDVKVFEVATTEDKVQIS